MASFEDMEEAMKAKYEAMKSEGTPLEQLRAHTMSKGINGIRTIARVFKRMDDNGDKRLQFHEFKEALEELGSPVDEGNLRACFDEMDQGGDTCVNFDEFLIALRPPLSESRLESIDKAWQKFDRDGNNEITIDDLRGLYSAEFHPKFKSGEWTEDQVLNNWLDQFTRESGDISISKDEFINYYVGVSSSIDDDGYFAVMMSQAWKLDD